MRSQDQQSRIFYELCALMFSILRSPPVPLSYSDPPSSAITPASVSPVRRTQISPAGFASLLLGVSLALMLCWSVTFVIGFILMPWVLGLIMVFYMVGIVSNLSGLGRAILYHGAESAGSRKEISVGIRYPSRVNGPIKWSSHGKCPTNYEVTTYPKKKVMSSQLDESRLFDLSLASSSTISMHWWEIDPCAKAGTQVGKLMLTLFRLGIIVNKGYW